MSSVVFFLKAMPPKGTNLPADTKLVGLEPPFDVCGGADPRCSSAYSALWQSLKDGQGRVLPNLLKKHAPGATRVAFVGFSAAHGFLNPFLNNDADRAATSAVILMDATFGGGKSGYQKAAHAAATGQMLLVSCTSDKGTTDALSNGDYAWRQFVWGEGDDAQAVSESARPPMPVPAEGVKRVGDLWYYRYSHAQIPHQELGKLLKPVVDAHLASYWSGIRASSGGSFYAEHPWFTGGVVLATAYYLSRILAGKGLIPTGWKRV